MKKYKAILSPTAPEATDALWIHPIGDGFTVRARLQGEWKPIKLASTNNTSNPYDDNLIGAKEILDAIEDTAARLPVYNYASLPQAAVPGAMCFVEDASIDSDSPQGIPLFYTTNGWKTALGGTPYFNIK